MHFFINPVFAFLSLFLSDHTDHPKTQETAPLYWYDIGAVLEQYWTETSILVRYWSEIIDFRSHSEAWYLISTETLCPTKTWITYQASECKVSRENQAGPAKCHLAFATVKLYHSNAILLWTLIKADGGQRREDGSSWLLGLLKRHPQTNIRRPRICQY